MKILFSLFFLYFLICAYVYFTQKSKIFNRKYAKEYSPKTAKKIYFNSSIGKLEGAYTENCKNCPLVLYFSGNANNVIEFLDLIAPKIKNYNFVGFNYPGYVNSEGSPSEDNFYKTADEIFEKYKPDFVIGRSIGTAVAAYLASKHNFKGVLLITPFSSIECIAEDKYPFLPVKLLLKYKFNEAGFLSKSNIPISIIALKNDDVIPSKCLNKLLKSIKNLKGIIYLEGEKHANIYSHPKIIESIRDSLDKIRNNK